MVAALCTQIFSVSGTTAAVTKVQCHRDVSCCLAMDLEILQGSFWRTDVRTLIKFRMLLGKCALQGYKLLKKWLGTQVPSHETVCQWTNAIKNGRKETDDTPQWQWMNAASKMCH
jgi:hypothetical protein